jgi:hypothetical protein
VVVVELGEVDASFGGCCCRGVGQAFGEDERVDQCPPSSRGERKEEDGMKRVEVAGYSLGRGRRMPKQG